MREIKFRVWDKDRKTMLVAFPYSISYELQNDPFVAMQYTGLKDKNGKEIYEGDFIKYPNNVQLQIVTWDLCGFYGEGDDVLKEERIFYIIEPEHCEVIGDVYSNPELLTK